ncbi:VOC family protein [Saccharothrix variisporea]|uniref:Glyoxalase-like protein n=1 Tax=Saccharothrix variisporea TaxID=543527 RepID=A0A495XDJ7_9PSEU|nr:VOC family protein [Saccharothrix variisporea]RKT72092.1 glyoxalase-like protein [Saccharothrix variisporea]
MRIDHVLYAAPSLEAAVDDLADRLGVRAAGGGQHPGAGTHNRLLGLGPHTYLEVIAPDPTQPEPASPRPYGVDGVTSGRVVGWALTVDDIDAAVARARSRGFDPGDVIEGQRRTPDGELLRWRLTANARTAGVVPFLIDWGATPHPARSAPAGLTLVSLHVEHPDPAAVEGPLRALGVDIEVREAAAEELVVAVDGPLGVVKNIAAFG